jgi:8-oxo-dGTP diphosphatase
MFVLQVRYLWAATAAPHGMFPARIATMLRHHLDLTIGWKRHMREPVNHEDADSIGSTPMPRVGVGVIVLRDGRILLGKRKGSHGAGTWALPGGHLEFGESVEDCAIRETQEETGLAIEVLGPGPYTNDVMPDEGRHYVTCFVLACSDSGKPEVLEPEKCDGWHWLEWSHLPENLFAPLHNLIKQGYRPPDTA